MNRVQLENIALDFWDETELAAVFPRNIEQAIALKLPVTVVKLPVVTVLAAVQWLRRYRRLSTFPDYPSDLMGCLYAHRGKGFIFLCGADPEDEQRFTLAHDIAHFLVDYWLPRQRVIHALGPGIANVLDGQRSPKPTEKATAILAHVRLGPHWHLLPRSGRAIDDESRVARAEDIADLLGLELVAPGDHIRRALGATVRLHRNDAAAACKYLGQYFGLPAYVFEGTTQALFRRRAPTFLEDAMRILGR